MESVLDFFSTLDSQLDNAAEQLGAWTYGVLFLIIYAETGLVVAPWLPGDSLLFAVGAICARGVLKLPTAVVVLWIAAFVGNYTNFLIGRAIGIRAGNGKLGLESAGAAIGRIFGGRFARFVPPHHLARADAFFRSYGPLAVMAARFLPFLRTLVPFVAGLTEMKTPAFLFYSAVGGFAWVAVCCTVGYYFFNLPWVKDNFALVIVGLFALGFVPVIYSYVKNRWKPSAPSPDAPSAPGSVLETKPDAPARSQQSVSSDRTQ